MRTRLTEQYGLEVPLIGPGLAFAGSPALTAAVSNAGGLGLLGALPEGLMLFRSLLRETRKLTERPFGVEFDPQFCSDALIEECILAKVAVAVFFWEAPPAGWVRTLHRHGIRAWACVGSVPAAREAVWLGADAIIAQGTEGVKGGGSLPAFSLIPDVVDAVAPVPVIAAGAISDSRRVAAALALGAEGVSVGTHLAGDQPTRQIVADLMSGAQRIIRGRLQPMVSEQLVSEQPQDAPPPATQQQTTDPLLHLLNALTISAGASPLIQPSHAEIPRRAGSL
ncbi:MAG: nitronate monooxygenase [Acidobacteria bacterium]|nr:nitronate monooxygenase [Acidobacteriota bacterium]